MKALLFLIGSLLCAINCYSTTDSCRTVQVMVERLPELLIARAGHAVRFIQGELTVFGGHTDGFIPTQTAEYLSGGQWHTINMTYTHDNSLSVTLKSGQVLIAGGHEKHLGIGQTYVSELYNPKDHTFTGFGCLDKKRSLANGIETDSGHVIISGNWHADDDIEIFDGKKHFTHVKEVTTAR